MTATAPKPAAGFPGFDPEQNMMAVMLLADLRCPVGAGGTTFAFIDALEVLKPILAYHLTRCGWRPDLSRRRIKARKIYGPGTLEGAVDWVDIGEPDDPLANLANMTITQIEALEPEDVKLEAKRRLGLPLPAPARAEDWHTQTNIAISDEPDTEGDDDP